MGARPVGPSSTSLFIGLVRGPRNDAEAAIWYRRAAEAGDAGNQHLNRYLGSFLDLTGSDINLIEGAGGVVGNLAHIATDPGYT
jgi:TPR repeat protein